MTTRRATVEKIAAQIGSTLLDDSDRWVNRFQINSQSSNRVYVIAQQRSDGVWGCSCPGWRNYRRCKHTTDLLRRLSDLGKRVPELRADSVIASASAAFLILEPDVKVKTTVVKGRQLDL